MWRSSSPQFFGAALYEPTKMPEKLQLTYLSTSEQTEAMKEEIRDKIDSLRDKLNSLECELLARVDELAAEQDNERKELEDNIASMQTAKEGLQSTKGSDEVKSSLAIAVEGMDKKIDQFTQKLHQHQKIVSTWNTEYWDSCNILRSQLSQMCKLSNVKITASIYQSKRIPKWQICNGSNPSQLQSPVSLAIQYLRGDIFVSDMDGMRIQVFSREGEHKQIFENLHSGPFQLFSVDFKFLSAFKDSQILECKLKSLNTAPNTRYCEFPLSKVVQLYYQNSLAFKFVTGYCSLSQQDPTTLSICKDPNIRHFCIPAAFTTPLTTASESSTSDTDPKKEISISLDITPVDIVIYKERIFLLASYSGDLVYEYTNEGVFIRSFFPCPASYTPLAMCIDREGNIIIAGNKAETAKFVFGQEYYTDIDYDPDDDFDKQPSTATTLFVLTQKGDVIIHDMDVPCGNCIGVAVNPHLDIFLLNKDYKNILTAL